MQRLWDGVNAPRLLLIEDEDSLARPTMRGLNEEGFLVTLRSDGVTGLKCALSEEFDVLVVDWRLPDLDGRTLIERIRAADIRTSILMLTAMRDVDYRIAGLDAGADDYLTKPFVFAELLARLRALLRRTATVQDRTFRQSFHLEAGSLHMDTARRKVTLAGMDLNLRTKEFRLLELLLRQPGEVITRTAIAETVWGTAFDVTDNAIDVTVSNLRSRLELDDGLSTVQIGTIRGVGYRLSVVSADDDKGQEPTQ